MYENVIFPLCCTAGVNGGDPKEGVSGSGKGLNGDGVLSLDSIMRGVNVGDKVGVSGRGGNCMSSYFFGGASSRWIIAVNGGE